MRKTAKYALLAIALTLAPAPAMFAHSIVRINPWRPHHQHTTVYVPAAPRPARTGTVKLDVEPNSASVYVNGGYVGDVDKFDGPFQGLDLKPGNYQIRLTAPGYKTSTVKVYVAPGETVKVKEQLVPLR